MAEAMAFMVGRQMMDHVISLLAQELNLSLGCKTELERLKKRLELVHSLINDASANKKLQLDSVKKWLKQLNSVASEADNVLDKFTYETLRRKVENRKMDKLKAFFSPSTSPLSFSHNMAHKIRYVNQKLDRIYAEGKNIGLVELVQLNDSATVTGPADIRLTHRFIDDDSVILGRDGDISNVVEMLCNCNDDKILPVLAIVGLGGQGKTTLAQLICKDKKVMRQFDEVIWVCVSENFDVTRLLNEMAQYLTGTNPQLSNIDGIIKSHLGQKLSQRRYLLVLDDVWNEDEAKWGCFKTALMGISAAKGSRILVTTRSTKVASTMESSCIHPLKGLSVEESWNLFEQRAFAKGGPVKTTNLEDIGKKIVERCGGLPLAIQVIGRVMYFKMFETDWLAVKNSHFWNSGDSSNRVLQTLKLSYDQLPLSIKSCFSICSFFVKDEVIIRNELIQIWMALGLLQPSVGSDLVMEDVGDNFFNTLLSNYFLQDAKKDEYEVITRCKMHDLVHDLALETAKNDYATLMSQALVSKQFNYLAHLRVLVLENYNLEELPDSIRTLIHLRYLDISRTRIFSLSNSITRLYNLQTLKLPKLRRVPKKFGNLLSLRQFYISYDESTDCILPGMERLIDLQTIPFFRVNRERGCHIKVLGNLKSLGGDLLIYGLEDVKNCEEARDACLSEKSRVRTLSLSWEKRGEENEKNDESVLQGLEPHSNLQGLTIENFVGRSFPHWMMVESQVTAVLRNLVKIKLSNCDMCEQIPPLGQLQHLKVVEIKEMNNVKVIGEEFYGKHTGGGASSSSAIASVTVFPALRELRLCKMAKLETWLEVVQQSDSRNVFPCLEELCIEGCSNLKSMPSYFPALTKLKLSKIDKCEQIPPLGHLPHLKVVEIEGMNNVKVIGEEFYGKHTVGGGASSSSAIASVTVFPALRKLSLYKMAKLETWSEVVQQSDSRNVFPYLEELYIEDCSILKTVPSYFPGLTKLKISKIDNSVVLKQMSYTVTSLTSLDLEECKGNEFEGVLEGFLGNNRSLRKLRISRCDGFSHLPNYLMGLEELDLWRCDNIRNIPCLPSARVVWITECEKVIELPDFQHLQKLTIGGYEELDYIPLSSSTCSNLESLVLIGGPKIKSLPEQLQHLQKLTSLRLKNIDGLESLPEWLGNLSSLQSLYIGCCEIKYMPSVEAMRRLTKLNYLGIHDCPLLEERCKEGSRPEWSKISHISTILINAKFVKKNGVMVMDGW